MPLPGSGLHSLLSLVSLCLSLPHSAQGQVLPLPPALTCVSGAGDRTQVSSLLCGCSEVPPSPWEPLPGGPWALGSVSLAEASADLLQKKCIGPKEESGFTEHSAESPLTTLPGDSVSTAHAGPQ